MSTAVGGITGGNAREHPAKLNLYMLVTCIFAAMAGGLIFGYDIGISGSVRSTDPFLKKFFPGVLRKKKEGETTNEYCRYDNSETLTMFTSSVYLAALVASTVTRLLRRKIAILLGGFIYLFGSVLTSFASNIWFLIIGRILNGFAIGFVNQAVPLYLSEMAPFKHRGVINIGFQLSIAIGILMANILNYFLSEIDGNGRWRWSFRVALVIAFIFSIGSIVLPETPNSVIEYGGDEEYAKTLLRRARGVNNVDEEFHDLVRASEKAKKVKQPWRKLLQRKYRPHLTMVVAIPFFQQLTGINVIMLYAPVLLHIIGFGGKAVLISVLIISVVNVAATMILIYGVDKWGRRKLFLEGGVQMLICQIIVAACIGAKFGIDGTPGDLPMWYTIVVVFFICVYVAGFAWSWGPLGWLVPSEIYPLEIRSAAQSINVSVNMFFTFVVAQVFLTMLCHLKFGLFLVFAFFLCAMSLFVFYFLPETKGIPIEEMGQVWRSHWFWSRFVEGGADYANRKFNAKIEKVLAQF